MVRALQNRGYGLLTSVIGSPSYVTFFELIDGFFGVREGDMCLVSLVRLVQWTTCICSINWLSHRYGGCHRRWFCFLDGISFWHC